MTSGIPVRESTGCRTARIVRTLHTGSSGATVRIYRQPNGELRAVKSAANPRVPARAQAAARETILPFLAGRLPEVLFAGSIRGIDTLVTRCPSPTTLADSVIRCGTDGPAPAVWQDFVTTLCRVWELSGQPGFDPELATRKHALRWQRGTAGLHHTLQAHGLEVPLRGHVYVNGCDYGSLGRLLQRLAHIPAPQVHVACQGDPQPRNILLDAAGGWHLVDWEWAGLHQDWRMMISHLIGWWYVEDLLTTACGEAHASRTALSLSYPPPQATLSHAWSAPVVHAFSRMTTPLHRALDLTALARHIAMLLLREIPRSLSTGRHHLLAPLLGEAVRLTDATHPLLEPISPQQQRPGASA
ncbi:hypothetical protein LHJ74_11480 [Streptomyces sp. N2-109]|uniref:Aminoglycoside phosphotransferase domain-containing protein n=1 Tax=Streptomyces gossypii TaxID=2883101 RepID=A0ABT2JRK5_9ACTN|nr:hypothetical protein [Streptomyces gossypii]MCT2590522.1 hypothetical protein [Streptomyces gossypii]